jgi:glycosyltransferase involved in cell wall biosynthesis
MKIALVHTRLLRLGGLETRLFAYMEHFRALGHEVHVFVYKIGEGVEAPPGVHVHRVKVRWVPKKFRAHPFDYRLKKILPGYRFDLVLSLMRNSCADAVVVPWSALGHMRATGQGRRSLSDRLAIDMDRRTFVSRAMVLACSEVTRDEVVELYHVPREKIEVLYPPIDVRRFRLELKRRKPAFRKKYGLSEGTTSFVFVSTSHTRKGLPLLVEVFRTLRNEPVELLIAGKGRFPSNAPPNIRDLGYVHATEELYAAADISVLPANYEPFGQVVPESILCGTPVIVSPMVGAKVVVTAETGMIVEDTQVDSWVTALRSAITEPFTFDPGYAARFQLSLPNHVERMLELMSERERRRETE